MRIYDTSRNEINGKTVCMARMENHEDVLVAPEGLGFQGEVRDGSVLAPLNHENACALRRLFPFTAPTRVLTAPRSFGVGDRLGLACPGHLRVFRKYDAHPVLVQQSIRELDLTGRRYEDVLDCVTFAVFREGFKDGFGADGDHLKKPEDIEYALGLGFTMITLDLSDHIREDREGEIAPYREIYLNRVFDVGEGQTIRFDEASLKKCAGIYGPALDFAVEMYNRFLRDGKYAADFEISIDEISVPTSPEQHFFVANELTRRGVAFATIAPRFIGEFQKGIDYIGDLSRFTAEIEVHAQIARHFGYKLSIHSGSDKFSVFPAIGKATREVFHVKTAGTNWLEAMKIVAEKDPGLYWQTHAFALAHFSEATKYYHVTTNLNNIPALEDLTDAELPELFRNNDARQLIHITYGLILQNPALKRPLYELWARDEEAYAQAIDRHISRHLQALGCPEHK